MKRISILLLFFINALGLNAIAQQNNKPLGFYLGKLGELVDTKDSAQFMLIVKRPDSITHLYTVDKYDLKTEKRVMAAQTRDAYPLMLEGTSMEYFPSGKRKSTIQYLKNFAVDTGFFYFPNGNIYKKVVYGDAKSSKKKNASVDKFSDRGTIVAEFDSTGNPIVVNGNGHYIGYDDDFKTIAEEGDLVEGQKNGTWKGSNSICTYTEQYENGMLISGNSVDKAGIQHTYTQVLTNAIYNKSKDDFNKFLAQKMHYPPEAREKNMQGKLLMNFIVNEDGSLTNIRCVESPYDVLAQEGLRVMQLSPKWHPATSRGIAVKQLCAEPMSFGIGYSVVVSRPIN